MEACPRPSGRLIWLHAASVGEVVSILPVLRSLAGLDGDLVMLVTTATVTSAALLEERLPGLGLATKVLHRFVPLDVPAWAGRFLDHWRPDAAGFVESEIWPNILAACAARAIPVLLMNARMSVTSFKAWSRVPSAARTVLSKFGKIHARSEEDASRLRALGADHVEVTGDLKRATDILPADQGLLRDYAARLRDRPVFLAASTHAGEEAQIAAVHDGLRQRHAGLLTIIVPRHPERGGELARLLNAPRRRLGQPPPAEGVWIADTLGELGLWYRLCHVSFVGRSLIDPGGGQNPLEPARLGRAIGIGPFTSNFDESVALLRAADAIQVVTNAEELVRFADAMLSDPEARRRMGERAEAAARSAEVPRDEAARTLLGLALGS